MAGFLPLLQAEDGGLDWTCWGGADDVIFCLPFPCASVADRLLFIGLFGVGGTIGREDGEGREVVSAVV